MGEQVDAGVHLKNTRKSLKQNRHILAGGEKGEIRSDECVNPFQQGSAVQYNWFLPVIGELKGI